MENNFNQNYHVSVINIKDIEKDIRTNRFNSKEVLTNYLLNLKQRGIASVELTNEKIQELLNLYDSLNKKEENPLDMQKYASVALDSQDLIVSKETDKVLKTLEGNSAFTNDFQQVQNELTATKADGLANADLVFEHMTNYQKEEVKLIPIAEITKHSNISQEMLSKVKFFITHCNINPNACRVDTQNEFFYNLDTNEVYEVRKNINTNQYEIFKSQQQVYGATQDASYENTPPIEQDQDEELLYNGEDKTRTQGPVRKLVPPKPTYNNRAAFTKIGFLVVNVITFALLTAMIILLNK